MPFIGLSAYRGRDNIQKDHNSFKWILKIYIATEKALTGIYFSSKNMVWNILTNEYEHQDLLDYLRWLWAAKLLSSSKSLMPCNTKNIVFA